MTKGKILIVCTTDSMIWNFLVPHIKKLINDDYQVECACSVNGDFYANLVTLHNIKIHKIDFKRNPYSIVNIKAYFMLKSLVKKNKYDLIFCHEPIGGVMGRLVGHLLRCKVIYMAHGFHFYKGSPPISKLYYVVERLLAHFTDILLTINREDFEASLLFKAKKKILIPGIGVDISKFVFKPNKSYLRNELHLGDSDIILLSVGELSVRKNHSIVIEAVALLKQPNIHYVIAGCGELEHCLRAKVNNLHLSTIHFLGYRTDINALCNSSDIFIMPSLQEGLSVALMEAMSCALPIIASNIRGNFDLITNDKGGFLVDVEDALMYARAIKQLICNSSLREQMGAYNMTKVRQYSVENVQKQLIPIVEGCIEKY